jgi:G3E family GTPase
VDAAGFLSDHDNPDLALLKLRQVGFADLVILNKVDLTDTATISAVRAAIDHSLNRVRVVETVQSEVPLEILLSVGRFDPASEFPLVPEQSTNTDGVDPRSLFQTYSYESDRPFQLSELKTAIRRNLPATIYRCKGILATVEHPSTRVNLQAVGRRTNISTLDPWGARDPRTKLVAIGSPDAVDPTELTAVFDSCLQPN